MAILLTVGTGKTGQHIARLLHEANIPFLVTSRKGQAGAPEGMNAARFDWLDPSTFNSPFEQDSLQSHKISAVYLIAPEVEDPTEPMTTFIDNALTKHGVKRFVLMAGSNVEPGGADVGKVWQYLMDKQGLEWTMLRATWFMGAKPPPSLHNTYTSVVL